MRKKSKGKRVVCASAMFTAAIIVVAVVILGIAPVSAASVTRVLPDPAFVAPSEEFTVTLTQTGFFFNTGTVIETLPTGFAYVAGSYVGNGDASYDSVTRNLKVNFSDEVTVTYNVTAAPTPQTAVFTGRYGTLVPTGGDPPYEFEEGPVSDDTNVVVDAVAPYTDGHNPAKSVTGVPVDTNIVVHVKDDHFVDATSILMTVDAIDVTADLVIVPNGAVVNDWIVTYNPPDDFGEGETVEVTVDASDGAGNAMTQDVYSFTTEGPASTIIGYYRSLGSDPNVVETGDLLKAADDWREDITPPGFTASITTQELLQLADEWRST